MPFLKGMNIAKNTNTPFYERFGAEMYRSNKKNIYATAKDTTKKPTAQTPTKSYSAVIDDDESSEGVSMEYVKPELQTLDTSVDSKEKDGMNEIKLDFNSDNVLNGIILSEILGKPVSKRKSRW